MFTRTLQSVLTAVAQAVQTQGNRALAQAQQNGNIVGQQDQNNLYPPPGS